MAARAGTRARPAGRPVERSSEPLARPRLVARPAPRARIGSCLKVATLIVLAGLMVAVPVWMNTASVQAEVRLAELEQREADLMAERSSLQARAAALASLDRVELVAEQLGMVDTVEFEYLDLGAAAADTEVADGTVVGQPRRR